MPPTLAFAPVQPTNGDGRVGARHYRTLAKRRSLRVIPTRVALTMVSVSHSALHIRSRWSAFLNPILTTERPHATRVLYAPRLRKREAKTGK